MIRPSAISSARNCLRKWAFGAIYGYSSPSSEAQRFGTKAHAAIEAYLKEGKPFNPDIAPERVAEHAVNTLPYPPYQSEEPLCFVRDGYEIRGTADLRWVKGDTSYLQDFKFVGNLRYAKKESELRIDPQLVIYGLATLDEHGTDKLVGRWVYVCKKSPHDVVIVRVELNRDELEKIWRNEIKKTVDKAVALEQTVPVPAIGDVEADKTKKECWAYGGCPHRVQCELEDAKMDMDPDFFKSLKPKKEEKTDLIDEITSRAQDINPPEAANFDDPMSASKEAPKKAPKKKKSTKSYTLYLRCMPTANSKVVNLSDFLAPIMRAVESDNGLAHWSLADYGKGKGLLAEAVKEVIASGSLAGQDLVVLGYAEEVGALESVLIQHADRVIVGVR